MTYRAPLAFAAALLLAGCGGSSTTTTSKAPAVQSAPSSAPSPVPGFPSKKAAAERLEAIKKEVEKRYKILQTKTAEPKKY